MKIFKFLVCLILLATIPQYGYCQTGKAVRQVSKIFMKKGAKKGVKEGVESAGKAATKNAAKKTAKEIAGEAAELSIRKNAGKSLTHDVAVMPLKKEAFKLEEMGAEKLLRQKIAKEVVENSSRGMVRQGEMLLVAPVEASVLKKVGTRESRELLVKSSKTELKQRSEKSAAKKAGIRAGKTFKGVEALNKLDDMPALKELVSGFEKRLGPNFSLDNLVVRRAGKETIVEFAGTKSVAKIKNGVVSAKSGSIIRQAPSGQVIEGELNQFLNHPLPNTQYVVDDFIKYETDHLGRTVSIEANSSKLFERMQKERIEHGRIDTGTRSELLKQFGEFDKNMVDYGHLLRREIGGPNEAINALPMKKEMQRAKSRWFKLEQKEVVACKAGKEVRSKIRINYTQDGKYIVEVEKIIDGRVISAPPFTDLL